MTVGDEKETSSDLTNIQIDSSNILAVNPIFMFVQISSVVIATKVLSNVLPAELYFSFRALLFDASSRIAPFAVVIKIFTPVLTAFLLVFAGFAIDRLFRSKQVMPPSKTIVLTMQTAGFAVAILLSWPMIVHWDVLADGAVNDRKTAFFVVYGLYAATYFYASGIGAKLAYRMSGVSSSDILATGSKWTNDAVFASVTAITATSVQTWLGLV